GFSRGTDMAQRGEQIRSHRRLYPDGAGGTPPDGKQINDHPDQHEAGPDLMRAVEQAECKQRAGQSDHGVLAPVWTDAVLQTDGLNIAKIKATILLRESCGIDAQQVV